MGGTEDPEGEETPVALGIVGATATGKTGLALRLAEDFDGEIINADALQVYRGLDIGTAKPTAEEQRRVPHHLIDILDPTERFSAGDFRRRALRALDEIRGRDRLPIVVGGSGLYLRALRQGISPIPVSEPPIRGALDRFEARRGLSEVHRFLRLLDPPTAARLRSGDRQRLLRALEVALGSGRSLSAWIARRPFGARPLPMLLIGLTLPREVLYDQIEGRARKMLEEGWVEEVQTLLAQGVPADAPAFQAIGYRSLIEYLEGSCSLEQALLSTARATRRYAKRQETWFRKEPGVRWFEAHDLVSNPFDLYRTLKRGFRRANA